MNISKKGVIVKVQTEKRMKAITSMASAIEKLASALLNGATRVEIVENHFSGCEIGVEVGDTSEPCYRTEILSEKEEDNKT